MERADSRACDVLKKKTCDGSEWVDPLGSFVWASLVGSDGLPGMELDQVHGGSSPFFSPQVKIRMKLFTNLLQKKRKCLNKTVDPVKQFHRDQILRKHILSIFDLFFSREEYMIGRPGLFGTLSTTND